MGRKANPTVIGAFVVGAIALAVIALMVLGSGKFFKDTVSFVVFFPGSVNGLSVGAPVKFKGVAIGEVTDIRLSVDEAYREEEFSIPVFIEIDPDRMTKYGASLQPMDLRDRKTMNEMYRNGLRAQLQTESFVTGVLYVGLDVFPDAPLKLHLPKDSRLREIPALPTPLEQATSAVRQILAKLDEIDFKSVIEGLDETVGGINRLVNSPRIDETFGKLGNTLESVDEAAQGIRKLAASADTSIGDLSARLNTAVDDIDRALRKAEEALSEASATFDSVSTLLAPGSPLTEQVGRTLEEVGDASRSVRRLADSLERNPSAVIYGRGQGEEE